MTLLALLSRNSRCVFRRVHSSWDYSCRPDRPVSSLGQQWAGEDRSGGSGSGVVQPAGTGGLPKFKAALLYWQNTRPAYVVLLECLAYLCRNAYGLCSAPPAKPYSARHAPPAARSIASGRRRFDSRTRPSTCQRVWPDNLWLHQGCHSCYRLRSKQTCQVR